MKGTVSLLPILLGSLALQGCTIFSNRNDLVPTPTIREFDTFESRLPGVARDTASIVDFKSQLVLYIGEYHQRASDRRKMEWESTGMTTYGGLAAVAGALADKMALVNTGAVVAGLGLTTSARYSFAQQSQIYLTAVRKLSCINSKLVVIPNPVFDDAVLSPDKNAAAIAKGAVRQMTNTVDAIRIEANNGLLGIAPGVPSRDELLVMLKSYLPSSSLAGAQAPLAPDPDAERRKEAGEQIKSLLADTSTCAKL